MDGRGDIFEMDCRWKGSGAAWKWVRARGRVATRDGRGRAVRIRGTVTDATELKRLQESFLRLSARESMLGAMVRNVPGGAIGLFDHDLRFILVDGRGEVGEVGDKRSLAGGLVFESYPPEHREQITVTLRAALAGKVAEVETQFAGKDVELRAGPVLDSEGRVVMGVATVQATTKRRGAATRVDRR
jgi:PAS domain-containing protein